MTLMTSSKIFSPPLKKQEECSHKKHSVYPQCQGEECFCREVLIHAHPCVLLSCIAQDMAEQTSDHLKVRACLLVLMCLWQWTQQILATTCSDGEVRVISKGEKKCCPKCISNTGKGMMCLSSFCSSVLCQPGN